MAMYFKDGKRIRVKKGSKKYKELTEDKPKKSTTAKPIVLDKRGVETKAGQRSSDVIQLGKKPEVQTKKTGIAAYREKKTIGGYATKILTSPKTTVVLGTTLATMLGAGAATGALKSAQAGGKLLPSAMAKMGTRVNVNAIGKAAGLTSKQTAALARQIGRERINVLARYAVNPKSSSLTKKLFIGLGFTALGASIAKDILGTYPFAGFIKEEALQTLSIPIMKAIDADDMETAREQMELVDELLANKEAIKDKIPYVNVLKSLDEFFAAAEKTNEAWKEIINATEEKPSFAEEKAAADEEAKQRDLAEMQWKSEYYALIREGKFEEAEELLQSQ